MFSRRIIANPTGPAIPWGNIPLERYSLMLTTLAFLAALPLAPAADQGNLTLANLRTTYGVLGPTRAEAKLLPGDNLVVHFDIENVAVDKDGKVQYSTALEVTDSASKVIFQSPPRDQELFNTLGGTSVPAYASVDLGLNQAPGDYTLKVTVKDRLSMKVASLIQKFQVLPAAFGFIRTTTTSDADGHHPAACLCVGESLYINSLVTGFTRDAAKKQPNLLIEMRVLDEKGTATLPKPFDDVVDKGVPGDAAAVAAQFLVSLTRAGKFTVELKATDQVSKKTVTQKVPLTVISPR